MGSSEISEGNITGRKEKKKKQKNNPQNRHLTATASREVAQRLVSTSSEGDLDREVWVVSSVLSVKTRPQCPEDNLKGIM